MLSRNDKYWIGGFRNSRPVWWEDTLLVWECCDMRQLFGFHLCFILVLSPSRMIAIKAAIILCLLDEVASRKNTCLCSVLLCNGKLHQIKKCPAHITIFILFFYGSFRVSYRCIFGVHTKRLQLEKEIPYSCSFYQCGIVLCAEHVKTAC